MNAETEPAGNAVRRRRRRKSKNIEPQQPGVLGFLRSERFGRMLFAAMALLALAYAAKGYQDVAHAGSQFGPLKIGMSAEQIRWALAGETQSSPGAAMQVFQRDGRTITLTLDQQGKLAGIACSEHGIAPLACPAILGVHVGDHPNRAKTLLGPGELQSTDGKPVLAYPAIGLRLHLEAHKVTALDLRPVGSEPASIWPIVLWRLFP
ncbi:MAG: hypothetical protein ACK4YM_02275 [Novosphingobium sp.]